MVAFEDGSRSSVPISFQEGAAAVPATLFADLGWQVAEIGDRARIEGPDGVVVVLRPGSPFVHWEDRIIHLADPPYSGRDGVWVPLQLVAEPLADRFPELYRFDPLALVLNAAAPENRGGAPAARADDIGSEVALAPGEEPDSLSAEAPSGWAEPTAPSDLDGPRVVVIDPGHGGGDPGASSPDGIREKDVALDVGLALFRLLEEEEGIEVRMTRSTDRFVPLWERGELATQWKGDRPGVFVSIHANSLPSRRSLRGFETYFLAESRTDHERRLTAIENAPLLVGGREFDPDASPQIGFILRDLRAHGLENWSSLLAELVQEEMSSFHPGPDRGVRQGVLAVLTNALMPSVLVELGYLSNPDEALILQQPRFQETAAAAIARALVDFFDRYPPGASGLPG